MRPDRPQTRPKRLLAQGAKRFSLGILDEGDEYYTLLDDRESHPLVRLYSMEDLEKMLDRTGLTDPIKVE